jgi:hypothetical protein
MAKPSWMMCLPFLCVGLFVVACSKPAPFKPEDRTPRSDKDAAFNPAERNPEWAFNSPSYMRPVEELKPEPRAKEGDPLHYFSKERLVQIRQPGNEDPDLEPRVAVWWTDNNGFHWHRAGYFGRGQTFFPFEVEEDGDYGVRFVGPGETPAVNTPAYPERVYHVDTHEPQVEVKIDPEQSWYAAGQKVTISWQATDYHLIDDPVSIQLLKDFSAEGPQVVELQRGLAAEGSITYDIPADLNDQQVRFRIEALDRANNLGLAYSYSLQIVEPKLTEKPEKPEAASDPVEQGAVAEAAEEDSETVSPMQPDDAESVAAIDETKEEMGDSTADATVEDHVDSQNTTTQLDEAAIAAVEMDLIGHAREAVPFGRPSSPARVDGDAKTTPSPKPNLTPAQPVEKEVIQPNGTPTEPVNAEETAQERTNEDPASVAAEKNALPPQKSREKEGGASPDVTPPKTVGSELRVVDVTRGNGLLVPLPATVEPLPAAQPAVGRLATLHPWRKLRETLRTDLASVWNLPQSRFGRQLNKLFDGQNLAERPMLRPVGEPGAVTSAVAGVPADE